MEELIQHGLNALRDTLQQDKSLTLQNTSIGIVGPFTGSASTKKANFRTLDDEAVEPYLVEMRTRQGGAAAGDDAPADIEPTDEAAGGGAPPTMGGNAPDVADGDGDVQMTE